MTAVDAADAGTDEELTGLLGDGAEVAIDCSVFGAGQATAIRHTRRWGRVGLVGEGGRLTVDVSEALIDRQLTVHGSWVSSTGRMAEPLERLDRWGLHPETVVGDVRAGRGERGVRAGRLGASEGRDRVAVSDVIRR